MTNINTSFKTLLLTLMLSLFLTGCGDDDKDKSDEVNNPPITVPPIEVPEVPDVPEVPEVPDVPPVEVPSAYNDCTDTVLTGVGYECEFISSADFNNDFDLINAPDGMRIQPRSGVIHWTPLSHQGNTSYDITVTTAGEVITTFNLVVEGEGQPDPEGIYVSENGNDETANGTPSAPFLTLSAAASHIKANPNTNGGFTLLIRGGIYVHPEFGEPLGDRSSYMVRFTNVVGTKAYPNVIKALGNEYPKLVSDVNVISIVTDSEHFIIENLELEGTVQDFTLDDTLALWWADGGDAYLLTSAAIINNDSKHTTVRNNIIHDFNGAALTNTYSEHVVFKDNIIFNNGWWSTSGTHGFNNSKIGTDDSAQTPGEQKYTVEDNLVYANGSLIVSHVFTKGEVDLTIDEGNGLHLQDRNGRFEGTASFTHNLMVFNGKTGLGLNTVDKVTIKNNSFYHNGEVNDGIGTLGTELALWDSYEGTVQDNLLHSLPEGLAIKDSHDDYNTIVSRNVVNNTASNATLVPLVPVGAIELVEHVFTDPEAFDFSPAAEEFSGLGVNENVLERMKLKMAEFGLIITRISVNVDVAYLEKIRQYVFDTWQAGPIGDKDGHFYENLLMHVKMTDEDGNNVKCTYTYEQRSYYPEAPEGVHCE